ncbi:MAG: sensor histidine kinase [Chloroflexota bacterium]
MHFKQLNYSYLAQYLVLAFVALISVGDLYQQGGPWWLALALCAIQGALYHFWPQRHYTRYLAAQLLVVLILNFLHPIAVLLGFSFSVTAVILFPDRTGALWVAALILSTLGIYILRLGWQEGLVEAVALSIGFFSFATIYHARTRAEAERSKAQALLEELQAAHTQLQAYADQVENLAVAEERNRLARELHDTLGHRLTVAAVQLEGAQRLIPNDPQRAATLASTVRGQVSEALAELRRAVATLRAPLEADLPLPLALTRLAHSFTESTGLTIELEIQPDLPGLSGPQRLALYRAAQEGLTNVQRHAHARQARLRLDQANGQITLSVTDDGVGLPGDFDLAAGFGLRGLQERAAQLDGSLRLEPGPSGGARLLFQIPIPSIEAPHE